MLLPLAQPVPLARVKPGPRLRIISAAGAGFPSPAQDWTDNVIDLASLLRVDRAATFLFGVSGLSMIDAGIVADGLTIKSLEHLRDMADRRGFGLVLMGMPSLEKRLACYAQLYSRIGLVHEIKPLTETEMRLLLATHAGDFGIAFDPAQLDAIEAQAAVIRITRGNFRLIERLFAQMRRIMTLNCVEDVTADIVQAARDCLVIGPGN